MINSAQLRKQFKDERTMGKKALSPPPSLIKIAFIYLAIILLLVMAKGCNTPAWAYEQIDVERLATAIWHAEGIHSKHQYGILGHWSKPPRVICINTIKHALRDWNGSGDFIVFLGNRYCPVGASNDNGTNQFWIKNVRYYYDN